MKQSAHIEQWALISTIAKVSLVGVVSGHPVLENGLHVRTSRVIRFDLEAKTAETKNTLYTLGKEYCGETE